MKSFLKSKIMIVTIVTIILLIIIGFTFGGRSNITTTEKTIGNMLTPIQKFFYLGSSFISDTIHPVINVWKLNDENKVLRQENIELQNQIIKLKLKIQKQRDLEILKSVLNYIEEKEIDNYVTCNVIGKDPGNWFNLFTIDGGIKDGITKNSTVINGNGLIGIVYEVGDNWAKVMTIIDNRSRVSFEILSEINDNIGLINGSGGDLLNGYLFDTEANVNIGDQIVTSGLGLYPKGILIGTIKEVIVNKDELLKGIIVEPSVNFKKLDRVLVIPNTNIGN